jgi:hypothetical protein
LANAEVGEVIILKFIFKKQRLREKHRLRVFENMVRRDEVEREL